MRGTADSELRCHNVNHPLGVPLREQPIRQLLRLSDHTLTYRPQPVQCAHELAIGVLRNCRFQLLNGPVGDRDLLARLLFVGFENLVVRLTTERREAEIISTSETESGK